MIRHQRINHKDTIEIRNIPFSIIRFTKLQRKMVKFFPSEIHQQGIQIRKSKSNWEQLCQCLLGTILLVPLGNNRASFTQEKLCQCHLGSSVLLSLGNNHAVSFWNNCASITWEQLCLSHLETIVPVALANNHASLAWEQLCQS